MNLPGKKIYQTDLVLQSIVYLPMMVCYALALLNQGFAVLGALIQFFVGFVQVFSGAFHTIRYKDEVHQKYLIGAIGYLAFLFLLVAFEVNQLGILLFVFLFIIPVGIATWYYYLTWTLNKNAVDEDSKIGNQFGADDDILDDAMLR